MVHTSFARAGALIICGLTLLFLPYSLHSQNSDYFDDFFENDDLVLRDTAFRIDSIPAIFDATFNSDATKKDFKLLRTFRREKEDQVAEMQADQDKITKQLNYLQNQKLSRVQELNDSKDELDNATEAIGELDQRNPVFGFGIRFQYEEYFDEKGRLLASHKEELRDNLQNDKNKKQKKYNQNLAKVGTVDSSISSLSKTQELVRSNIVRLKEDLRDCEFAIDEALAPEKANQNFKMIITGAFVIIIGGLIGAFFFLIYKKSEAKITVQLLSDGGLQFITVFVLIIAIVLFGVLGILEAKELATILSGIAGYILGRSSVDRLQRTP